MGHWSTAEHRWVPDSSVEVLEPRIIPNGPAGHLRGGMMQGEQLVAPVDVGAQTFEPRVSMAMCLNADQLAHAIVQADLHQELVKVEVVPAFDPNGRRSYRVTIWSLPWP